LPPYKDAAPDVFIHLAAVVGASAPTAPIPGASSMTTRNGLHAIEAARIVGIEKVCLRRHDLLLPQIHARAVSEKRILGRLIRKKPTAPYGLAKKMLLVQLQALPATVWNGTAFISRP